MNRNLEVNLNNCNWKLKGYWPYVPIFGKSMETGNDMMGVTDWIDATVPGGVHFDLFRAGLIEDPYFERNSLKCEWVEHRWWMYKTAFYVDSDLKGRKITLQFNGLDYFAHIYLNGEKLGEHEGMFTRARFDVAGKLRYDAENELNVLFEGIPEEMAQIGHTSETKILKSRFAYKWDFCTRMPNIGIWDDVSLKVNGPIRMGDEFVSTDVKDDMGVVRFSSSISGRKDERYTIHAALDFEGKLVRSWEQDFSYKAGTGKICEEFLVENPRLWYPNGMGEQPLYRLKVQILYHGEISDEREYDIGIRRLEYRRNQDSPDDSLPYTFVINGEPVYIKGVNLTPFDIMYGNVSNNTYEQYLAFLKNANINLVRINGVGIIEKEYFYKLCDKHGIMVWQDFIQSGSGLENIPCTRRKFFKLLKDASIQAVKEKRNHVCHAIWNGGNELMDQNRVPVTYDDPNIKILKEIVEKYDPGKLFLPTTASGPNEFLNPEQPGKNHDVHGSWKFEGIEKHYKLCNGSDSLFHSEFGVDGCSSIESLKKFLLPENVKTTNMEENLTWRHHGEWWDTVSRDLGIFGVFSSLEQFVKASQFIQAEGIRYIVESNRRRKYKNSGSMVWQFNEPWPNVSNTCVVDYYGIPKMAYYWLRQAYAPIHASLKYEKLFYANGEDFIGELYVHNSLSGQEMDVSLEILDAKGNLIYSDDIKYFASGNSAAMVKKIRYKVPKVYMGIFFIRTVVYSADQTKLDENLYVFSQADSNIFASLLNFDKASFTVEKEDGGYRIKNSGDVVSLFLFGNKADGCESVLIDGNYSSLFPGEEKLYRIYPVDFAGILPEELSISWDCFNK